MQTFNIYCSIIRIMCGILLQVYLNQELRGCLTLFSWLKQQKVTPKNVGQRYINLTLCIMQTFAAIFVQVAFTISGSQEFSLRQIIKGFATILLAIRIDDMFAKNFPQSVFDNAAAMNAKGNLRFT